MRTDSERLDFMVSEVIYVVSYGDGFGVEQLHSCSYAKAHGRTPREAIDSAMQLKEEGREDER